MTKIIFDTNVYFSAIGWDGQLLDIVNSCFESQEFVIFISKEIYEEIELKLKSKRFFELTKNKVDVNFVRNTFEAIVEGCQVVNPEIKVDTCRDPKDNKFLELAKTVQADYLITGDKDLLVLKEFGETSILKPSEFLVELNLS